MPSRLRFSTVKSLLLSFSVFCLVCGLLLVIAGSVLCTRVVINNAQHPREWRNVLLAESMLVLKLGCIQLTVVGFGICGTLKQSVQMMATFRLLLALLIVVQIVLTVLLFCGISDVRFVYLRRLEKAFGASIAKTVRVTGVVEPEIEALQRKVGCCGARSYKDWGEKVPRSCYERDTRNVIIDGCIAILEGYVQRSGKALGWMLVSMSVFEFVTALFARCFSAGIGNQITTIVRT